ncbi:MAG: DUF4097 family beta strand repeat-containing protein [Vicinamibacterales bacterium]|nr:DUF4097 family beta strand repeat-containing protein [Vicinamibacterales bacterium]
MTRPVVLLAVALMGPACTINLNTEGVTAVETHRFTVTGDAHLSLETFAGAIEVHSWDRPEIEVEVEKRAMDQSLVDEMKVVTTDEGGRVTLTVTGPSRSMGGVTVGVNISPRARLRVAMPRRATLNVYSRDGSLAIEDIDGAVTLKTDDGSIRGMRLSGDLHMRTADGSIRVEKVNGRLDLETGDGSVTLDGTLTALRAKTDDGSVRVSLDAGSRVETDWDVETGDGSVVLRLPAELDAELDASTGDGGVRSTHPGVRLGEDGRRSNSARVTIGQGGRTIRVRTGDGSIRIES